MQSMLRKTHTALILAFGLTSTAAWAANHNVSVGGSGLVFIDATTGTNVTNITAGDTVTFTNIGGAHNIASDTGAITTFRCANGCDGTGGNGAVSGSPWTAVVTFPTAGTIGYHCEAHRSFGMVGTIQVATLPVELQSFEID